MPKSFSVTLDIYTDEEGTEYILSSPQDIKDLEKAVEDSREEIKFLEEGDTDAKALAKAREIANKRVEREIEKRKKIRNEYLPKAEKVTFTLNVPTYGSYLDAEKEATKLNTDGEKTIDEAVMMSELLSSSLQRQNASELSPNIAAILYNKLKKKAWPDPSLLPF